jgi:hypothetical protein
VQNAWQQFSQDVPACGTAYTQPPASRNSRFSYILDRIKEAETARATNNRKWRVALPTPATTAVAKFRRFLGVDTTTTNGNASSLTSDLGVPFVRVVATSLLSGIAKTRPVNLATTSPVDTSVLKYWINNGQP